MKIALLVAFDGSRFRGFARQRSGTIRTVQGTIDDRLGALLRAHGLRTTGAGRTDAGVHAWGQVLSFEAPDGTDPAWIQTRLNRWLAPEITVRAGATVPDAFDARFSATRRTYEYAIYASPVPNPFLEPFAVHVMSIPDVRAMRAAAKQLVGEHDFASFCRGGEGPTTRRLRSVTFHWREEGKLVIRFVADSYCQQMVRSLVGTLLEVGAGVRAPDDVSCTMNARDRAAAAPVAPAKGLTLVEVRYPRDPFAGASVTSPPEAPTGRRSRRGSGGRKAT